MKINANQIPPEGFTLEEEVLAKDLDLQTEVVKLYHPIKIIASISKIINVVCVDSTLATSLSMQCSRCLNGFELDFKKKFKLNYSIDRAAIEPIIDLNPDIRDQIILDYPIKPLCKPDCKGLCTKCGKNINEGECNCGTTEKKTF